MNKERRIWLLLLSVGVVAAVISVVASRSAQQPGLTARVVKLRSEVTSTPTSPGNFGERLATLVEWGNDLASRRRFTPQVMPIVFVRMGTAGFNQNTAGNISEWTQILGFIEDSYGKAGSLTRSDQSDLVAGEYATVKLVYTVGEVEVKTGAVFRLGHHFMSDGGRIQNTNPRADCYVTFAVENTSSGGAVDPAVKLEPTRSPWLSAFAGFRAAEPMPAVKVAAGNLKTGDRLVITMGDRSQGSRGYLVQTRDADDLRYPLEVDLDGKGVFVPLGIISVRVRGSQAAGINAIAPSVVAAGEAFSLRLRVEDKYLNPASFGGGTFKVRLNGREVGEIRVTEGHYTGRVDGLKLDREGAYRYEVAGTDGRLTCISNPILVERAPQQRIYWGELHGHSGWEEGTGSVPRYYEYARDVAFLDFGSLTGHDAMMVKPGWDEIRSETQKANRAGSFVAYMGYEWTVPFERGGHHNVFFKTDKGAYVTLMEAPRLPMLYEKLKAIDSVDNILVIPHAHQTGDWNYSDPEIERLVEMYSKHGSFEYFGQRYLRRGYRVGLIAASDDHTGHPGYAAAQTSTRNGLAAVYSPRLDRDGIWRAMKERATYATSGQRMVVKMSMENQLVGSAVRVGGLPVIRARALGTTAIDRIDVIHNGAVAYSRDYLAPQPGKESAIQVMFNSTTETPGDEVTTPGTGVTWRGWIEVSGGRIRTIEALGADHFTDQFHQADGQRVWFVCKTRGDFDGVLLRLVDAPADTKVTVRIVGLDRDPGPQGGPLPRGAGQPGTNALHEVSFIANDVARAAAKFEIAPFATVFARKVNAAAAWDTEFSYRMTKAPVQDDYYYLRVVQIDGEVAWTSPVWIGEQGSPKRIR